MEILSYNQAVVRLEEIMNSIQCGSMDVDSLAVALKEASALVKYCRARLFKVDEDIKQLLEGIDGEELM